jgi:MHS family proline/betaine transporter-like MFS transporter
MSEDVGLAVLRRRALVSTTIGNALEWFDFVVFGLFAGVIGKLFFATDGAGNALLLAFATFGVAFVARPLGGVLFGLVADRIGRKTALVWMIGLMAFGTGMIAVLPTYAAIGIAAPVLLVLARVIQGFSAGGEFGGASALLIEFAPPGRQGYFGAFQMMSQALAYALGAAIALALARALTPEAFASWGWRVPFAIGLLIGPVGVYLRRACAESPEFLAYRAQHAPPARPLRDLVSTHRREIVASFGVIAAGAAMNYVGVVFVPVYATTRFGLPAFEAQVGLLAASLVAAALVAPFGALSDRFGRRAVIAPALVAFAALFWLFMHRLAAEPDVANLWLLQGVGALFAAFAGPVPALMTEIFPVYLRATGASLAFNLAGAMFGGLAPAINGALVQATGNAAAPAYYIAFVAVLGLIGLAGLPRRSPA